jgi:cAMP-dependent protein kinase regulator
MFNGLDDNDMNVVIDAMDEKIVKIGLKIITEGESGNELYVVEEGELDCFKKFPDSEQPKYLKTYSPGEAFGELALLYNAPRAATITAKTDCQLWVLDRNTFNFIVKEAAQRKRDKYENFLKTVPLLSSMDHYERSKLADAIKEEKFEAEDLIIR